MLTGMKVDKKKKTEETEQKTILTAKSFHRRAWVSAHSGRFDLRQGHGQFSPIPCNRREMNSGSGRMRTFSSIFFFFNLNEISSEVIS